MPWCLWSARTPRQLVRLPDQVGHELSKMAGHTPEYEHQVRLHNHSNQLVISHVPSPTMCNFTYSGWERRRSIIIRSQSQLWLIPGASALDCTQDDPVRSLELFPVFSSVMEQGSQFFFLHTSPPSSLTLLLAEAPWQWVGCRGRVCKHRSGISSSRGGTWGWSMVYCQGWRWGAKCKLQ